MKPSFWSGFWAACVDSLLIHTLRSSMLTGGVVMLVSSTGMWQYFASSMHAHDAQRAVAHASAAQPPKVVVVAINDEGYNAFFGGTSPLNRGRVRHFLEVIEQSAPSARRIALDIDLSPGPVLDPWQDHVDRFLLQRPSLWTLPAPSAIGVTLQEALDWQQTMCRAGVRFGHPLVPTEFGYPKLTHQYRGGLTEAALSDGVDCADAQELRLTPAPLSPDFLSAGAVVPFSGDLVELADTLRAIEPDWVWVGAAWGNSDVFSTPFGARYGVQIHAASLSGAQEKQRMAPYWIQLLLAWWYLALMTALATHFMPKLQHWMRPTHESMSGHRFFSTAVLPGLFVLSVLVSLWCVSDLLALLRVATGVWVPTATIASSVLIYMLMVWVWGREAVRTHSGGKQAWTTIFMKPLRDDLKSIANCLGLSGQESAWQSVPGYRRGLELLLAVASMLIQNVFPALAVVMAVMRPL